METWKTPEMREWAQQFIEQEGEAGRTYRMLPTEPPEGFAAQWQIYSGNRIPTVSEFGGFVMEFMRRNEIMPTEADEVEDRLRDLTMAVQIYVRDVLQHGQAPVA
jgi:hypothetical protein